MKERIYNLISISVLLVLIILMAVSRFVVTFPDMVIRIIGIAMMISLVWTSYRFHRTYRKKC